MYQNNFYPSYAPKNVTRKKTPIYQQDVAPKWPTMKKSESSTGTTKNPITTDTNTTTNIITQHDTTQNIMTQHNTTENNTT